MTDLSTTKLADIWRKLPDFIRIYTYDTHEYIRETAGLYAWYLPLRMHGTDFGGLYTHITTVFDTANSYSGVGQFNPWEPVSIEVRRGLRDEDEGPTRMPSELASLLSQDGTVRLLRRYLLAASILAPPLYVGETGNLRTRYEDHRTGRKSGLHERLQAHANEKGLQISPSDLIYLTIEMPPVQSDSDDISQAFHRVVEWMMKRVARPPFGLQ